ncbi:glycosyltransferase family 4 protein [Vibrio variabilis]|uniref:glycosyltransferase family 4 protein n=1 Tax=Vibrio variabilis TaxID=990271 RepID=UPI000DD92951|nr:glycosyltransferase family 4 protein [Vibrio variabilis]
MGVGASERALNILSVNQIEEVRGGSDRCYFSTNEILIERGHLVTPFYSSKINDQYPVEIDFNRRNLTSIIKYFYNNEAKVKLSSLVELSALRFDLAHLHIYYGKLTSSILEPLRSNSVPIIQTLHEYKLSCPVYTHINNGDICNKCIDSTTLHCLFNKCKDNSFIASAVRYLEYNISRWLGDVDKVDRFICVSNFQMKKMVQAGVPESKLTTIYNFVDAENISSEVYEGDYLLFLVGWRR